MEKKLYRSTTDKKIAGVCGGLAAYLDIDVSIIRLLWVFLTFFAGLSFWIYIIAAVIIPEEPTYPQFDGQNGQPPYGNQPPYYGDSNR